MMMAAEDLEGWIGLADTRDEEEEDSVGEGESSVRDQVTL